MCWNSAISDFQLKLLPELEWVKSKWFPIPVSFDTLTQALRKVWTLNYIRSLTCILVLSYQGFDVQISCFSICMPLFWKAVPLNCPPRGELWCTYWLWRWNTSKSALFSPHGPDPAEHDCWLPDRSVQSVCPPHLGASVRQPVLSRMDFGREGGSKVRGCCSWRSAFHNDIHQLCSQHGSVLHTRKWSQANRC